MAHDHHHDHAGHDHAAGHRARSQPGLGFASGAGLRLAAALLAAGAAAGLAGWVESSVPPARAMAVTPVTSQATVTVTVVSTAPVARWTVAVDGRTVTGTADAYRWTGSVEVGGDISHEVIADLDTADAGTPTAAQIIVRTRRGDSQATTWGQGPILASLRFNP